MPQKLEPHKFRILDDVVDANITKNAAGHSDREASCFGERFAFNFNFVRASLVRYQKRKGMQRIVKSRQGYSATLTMIDRKTR